MTQTTTAPDSAKLARVANALADQFTRGLFTPGRESLFALTADLDVTVWHPRAGVTVLQMCPVGDDGTTGPAVSTVTVCPGAYRELEIVEGDGLIVGEAHGAPAAFAIAVDRLVAPVMGQHQHAHDTVSV